MSNTLLVVCIFTLVIHMSETLALSMRLAGARTKQVATSISFVNVSFLVSRMSNMLQAPLLGAMVDLAVRNGGVAQLEMSFRWLIFSAFLGTLIGAILIPSMVKIFEAGIYVFERKGSIPRLIKTALMPRNFVKIIRQVQLPTIHSFKDLDFKRIPHTFIYLNIAMTAIYAVGVLSALLAGALIPDQRATAVQLSGIVNGMATIMLAVMVDPTGAHITDQVVRGKRPLNDVRIMVFYLVTSKLVATLFIAQFLLRPAAEYIVWVAKIITHYFGG